jgi:hypothetical protein
MADHPALPISASITSIVATSIERAQTLPGLPIDQSENSSYGVSPRATGKATIKGANGQSLPLSQVAQTIKAK